MRDIDIRKELSRRLYKKYIANDPTCLLIDEFGLCQGEARIDVALINGKIHGYEIKSEYDTLNRLPSQLNTYGKIVDQLTVVASEKHLAALENYLPEWCGIMIAKNKKNKIVLKEIRKPKNNTKVDPFSLAQLLWKDEALFLLSTLGHVKGLKSKPRFILWRELVNYMPAIELRKQVRTIIKRRGQWRAAPKPQLNGVLSQSIAI